jgi:hypothetical protein
MGRSTGCSGTRAAPSKWPRNTLVIGLYFTRSGTEAVFNRGGRALQPLVTRGRTCTRTPARIRFKRRSFRGRSFDNAT